MASDFVYLPADQVHLIREFYQKYQPKLLALVETELWPNLIDQAQHFQVPCLLINARLSEKSAKRYAKVKGLTRGMLQNLQQLLAQDLATQQRFIALGMPSERTKVVGNIKFDVHAPEDFVEQAVQLQQTWQLAHRKIITFASTHAPEEQQLLTALKPYFADHPELLCIVVPRHPERFDEVAVQIQKLQLNMQRRSLAEVIQPDTQVYLADSMGEMWLWYALSQACYVGGSLNEPGGGHNILEPLALSVATVLGKNYFNFQSIVDEFVAAEAVYVVQEAEQAVEMLMQLLLEPALRAQLNQNAQVIMYKNRGSLTEHIHVMNQYL